jgi:acetyl-CoA synthetase
MTKPVWLPDAVAHERSRTAAFIDAHGIDDYSSLVERSISEPAWFWDAAIDFLGIPFQRRHTQVINDSAGAPWTTWFDDGALNLSEVCLDRWADDPEHAHRVALIGENEGGVIRESTFAELRDEVAHLAGALAHHGVRRGDRVALLLGLDDAVRVFLAIARLGAIAVPIFSGFGAGAVQVRLVDAGCAVLITTTSMTRRGRAVNLRAVADQAAAQAHQMGVDCQVIEIAGLRSSDTDAVGAALTDAETPVLLAYTSGTTGRPKGAVHVHGGLTVKLAQEGAFQADLRPGDRACWLTDMGWIMGPWITVAALANGATLVTYDGAPDWPDAGRVWSLVERHGLTFLGVSPTLIRSLAGAGDHHLEGHDLSSLLAFGSTGEPWNEAEWWWLFDTVGGRSRPIINLSGGTEIGACLLSVNLLQGCVPCSVGGPSLGVDVDVVDDDGRSLAGTGAVGELVVRGVWPGMTRGVWGDDDRYIETYWSRFPGIWCHGDWAEVDDNGFWFLHGRSDDTLNIAGKRIGPSEIESAATAINGVMMAAAVGLPHPVKGEVIGLWCVAATRGADEAHLVGLVAEAVEAAFGPAFRPAHVAFLPALPQTRSGKIVRRAVRARAIGIDPGDLSTLEDPTVLDAIVPVNLR